AAGAIFDAGVTVYLGTGNTLQNAGLLSPGFYENVQTTSLTGNFVQTPAGTMGVDLNLLPETNDNITSTGTALVQGSVILNLLNPGEAQTGSHDAVIVHADQGVTGHTGLGIVAIPSAVATYKLIYPNPNDIVLNYNIDYSPAGMNRNEHSLGTGVNEIETARTSPAFVPIAAALFYQPNVKKLAAVYDNLSGEGTSAAEQLAFTSDDHLMSAVDSEINTEMSDIDADGDLPVCGPGGAPQSRVLNTHAGAGSPVCAEPWSRSTHFWASGYGFSSETAGQASTGSASVQAGGSAAMVGIDHWFQPNVVVGAALAGGTSSYVVPARETTGTVYSTNIAAYGAWFAEHAYVNTILDFGSYGNNERRSAAIPGINPPSLSGTPVPGIPGFSENLTAQYAGNSVGGQIETGWRMHGKLLSFTPFVALRATSLETNPFTEYQVGGSPSQIGLSYASRNVFSIPAFLGGQLDLSTPVNNVGRLRAWVRLAWMHDFAPYRTISTSFISAPGYNFTTLGATPPRDSARIDTGMIFEIGAHVAFFGAFSGDVSGHDTSYTGSGGLNLRW
ncbi:MAG TPA: autotransporter domain-containing protein, partial [Acidocella sp.]|nr:autotransporter domain-containing protein [Acidocella sp.]